MTAQTTGQNQHREVFSSRIAFLLAAIGSAVGLGNIWRFPYIAYTNGGGAFLIPYLVALLTAGIPLLFFDYAFGHRYRGSAPLAYRRFKPWAEPIGWMQVGISFFITIYYAAIIGWALLYAFQSFTKPWGADPETYFVAEFLHASDVEGTPLMTLDFVPQIALALFVVWVVNIIVIALGVDEGIGRASKFFMPILTVLFIIVVIQAVLLPGAATGLNALFTPDWAALKNPGVWVAAYGQIFFSLSVAFGIMLTYSSYLRPRTNLTGTGLVTAFANSSFEVLAGIGVFSALGFMAANSGVAVDDVATNGIGLAFMAFPTIIGEMPGGTVFGFLFFLSLAIAGFTSLFSLQEVVVSAVRDKTGLPRKTVAIVMGVVMALLSLLLFSTTSGLTSLDIVDKFTNNIGIVGVAFLSIVVVDWVLRRLNEFGLHLNAVSSFQVGTIWRICVTNLTAVVLIYTLITEFIGLFQEPYGGYTAAQNGVFGWGVIAVIVIVSLIMPLVPWKGEVRIDGLPGSDFGVEAEFQRVLHTPERAADRRERHAGPAAEQYGRPAHNPSTSN